MKITLLFLVGILTLGACKKEADTTIPLIEVLSVSPNITTATVCDETENNVIPVTAGQTIVLKLKMTDNEGLSQYKIEGHENFDCHGHRSPRNTDWSYQQLKTLSGTTIEEQIELKFPADATAGNYHLELKVVDLAGNESEEIYYTILAK